MKNLLFIIFSITLMQLYSQNLVPNPSFEEYDFDIFLTYTQTSPTSTLVSTGVWFNHLPFPKYSLDYFNIDFNNIDTLSFQPYGIQDIYPIYGVPNNMYGHQNTKTGKGMAGSVQGKFYREPLMTKLKDSLIKNQEYCVSFYVNFSRISGRYHNKTGMYFSEDTIADTFSNNPAYSSLWELVPQIRSFDYINDTLQWQRVEGSLISEGGEQFVTISSFGQPDTFNSIYNDYYTIYNSGISLLSKTLLYFDDIAVYPCDAEVFVADCREDTTICLGDSLQIGTHNLEDYLYWWTPYEGIDSANSYSHVANPWVKPTETTTYYLTVKDFKFDESFVNLSYLSGHFCKIITI